MVSVQKILHHREKVTSYLSGKPIFPVTLELGLTTACNRVCRDCPSREGRPGLYLDLSTAKRLLDYLKGRTRGLIITGGEPTLHPGFGLVIAAASQNGFSDIVTISNGSTLDRDEVWQPLLEMGSAVRISLYDWDILSSAGVDSTLKRIERLRRRVEKAGSSLTIGVSVLTQAAAAAALRSIGIRARDAGAHWIYFHPLCIRVPASGVRHTAPQGGSRLLRDLRGIREPGFSVFFLPERFSRRALFFEGYHAAHFILVIAADGKNYLGSEVKFDPRYELADLTTTRPGDFLHNSRRSLQIASVRSSDYPAIASRNRAILYSDLIERMIRGRVTSKPSPAGDYLLPHIL